jgi:hypothetical protein
MKKIIYISFLSIGLISCQGNMSNENVSEEVIEEPAVSYAVFGEEITAEGIVSYEEFKSKLEASDTVKVKLAGNIDKTCTVKGCWMKVKVAENEEPMHITFKDYGFFVPKEGMENKATVFEGIAYMDTISVDMLRHYAEDEGLGLEEIEAIKEPEITVTFEASGVLIAK